MKTILLLAFLIAIIGFSFIPIKIKKEKKILVFCKTAGFRHTSIMASKLAMLKLGKENNIQVDTTEDAAFFTTEILYKYHAVVFLNTTGDVLNNEQQKAFEQYISKGNGFVGIHAASDTEFDWPWYVKLVGANFESHPIPQTAKLIVTNTNHIATRHLPPIWEVKDEWYNFINLNPNVKLLIKIDETSYTGGKNGSYHPIAWYHKYEGGRAFYTELGHTEEAYKDPLFLQHVLGGVHYAIGK